MWGEAGFRMQAWLPLPHTSLRQSIKAPNYRGTRRELGEAVWQPELEVIALIDGYLFWHSAPPIKLSGYKYAHKVHASVHTQFLFSRHSHPHKEVAQNQTGEQKDAEHLWNHIMIL